MFTMTGLAVSASFRRLLFYCLVGALSLAAFTQPLAVYTAVRFICQDEYGNPIPGLEILIGTEHQTTDPTGQALFPKIATGTRKVRLHDYYVFQEIEIKVIERDEKPFQIILYSCIEYSKVAPPPDKSIRVYWGLEAQNYKDAHSKAAELNRFGCSDWKIEYFMDTGWTLPETICVESNGAVRINLTLYSSRPVMVEGKLSKSELKRLRQLMIRSRLYSGGGEGNDLRPVDGSFEKITVVHQGVQAVLKTIGNVSFCRPGPRHDLVMMFHQLVDQARANEDKK